MWIARLVVVAAMLRGARADSLEERSNTEVGLQEYCVSTEAFEAKCLKNEVIVMETAIYGRMRIGRCLENEGKLLTAFADDPSFLGCSVDIVDLMDRKCSGRNQCEMRGAFDNDLQKIRKPCHEALRHYLEASYTCVTVIEADRSCHVSVTSNPLHIMRSSTTKLSCGTKSQPWTLEAPAGQQINVSLLDFGQRAREPANQHHCQQYGYIVDRAANKNVSICGLVDERRRILYTLLSNAVEIVLFDANVDDRIVEQHHILLGLQAIGCSNLIPPENAWLRRSNNEAVVGCYTSRQSWHLRCVGDLWIGVIGNCTEEYQDMSPIVSAVKSSSANQYQVMIIVSVGFLALVICCTVICIGAVILKRHYARSARHFHQLEENYKRYNAPMVQTSNKPMLVMAQPIE